MCPRPRNIDIDPGFAGRLIDLREKRRLSKADLADRAGLSYRTVLDLESGQRRRAQERTLMLLAKALDVPFDAVIGRDSPAALNGGTSEEPDPGDEPVSLKDSEQPLTRRWPWLIAAGFLAVVVGMSLWHFGSTHAAWTVDQSVLTMRDGLFGLKIWSLDSRPNFLRCSESPWSDEILLASTSATTTEGGWFRALDRKSGRVLWEVRPDIDAVARAFGEEIARSAGYYCLGGTPVDFDGDGDPEVVVRFFHGIDYPVCLCTVDRDGNLLAQYTHKGQIYSILAFDLDGDGKEEAIASGTNNSKAYQGATVLLLDAIHRSGASVDSLTDAWSHEPDDVVVRIVFPHFPEPYRTLLGVERLCARNLQIFHGPDHDFQLSVDIMAGTQPVVIGWLDARLRPQGCEIHDGFLETMRASWPDSLRGTGPADSAWRERWLASCYRFGSSTN
ncbi:MAG: helix-turn-helix domain-containing protein [Candidatus Krumholzibacteriia bacterium]